MVVLNNEINESIITKLNENEIYIIEVNNSNYVEVQCNSDEQKYNSIIESFNIEISDFETFNKIHCFTYTDEIIYCECGKVHFTDNTDLTYFDGGVYCDKCIKLDDILENYINNPKQAINNIDKEYLQTNNWHLIGNYDVGYHSDFTTINSLLNSIKLKNKYNYFFKVNINNNPWTVNTDLYIQLDKKGIIGGNK